jgi:uncharacterized protein (UPF0264 family)
VKLLVSPKDEDEALEASTGGADIIDVKNPAEGSLGASFPWIIKRVREIVPQGTEVSATLGDLPNLPGTASLAALGAATSGADYVKVGLLGPRSVEEAVYLMSCVVRSVVEVEPPVKVVAAGYADRKRAGTIEPLLVPEVAKRSGSQIAMLDTKIKDGKRLFDFLSQKDLSLFVEASHQMGLLAALAGSLQKEDIPILLKLNVDVIGVRTAACDGLNRVSGRINRTKVQELVNMIKQSSLEQGAQGHLPRTKIEAR